MLNPRWLAVLALALFSSAAVADDDLGLGPWRLGMSKDQVVAQAEFGPYKDVQVTGGVETANGKFAGHAANTSFVFDPAGLQFIQVWNYEGGDWRKAKDAALEVYDYLLARFGGVKIPGVTVNGSDALERGDVAVVLERILGQAEGVEANARKEKVTLTITYDMVPVSQPAESRLHAQFIYAGRTGTFYVFLFQDRPDAPSRIKKANFRAEKF